MKKLLVSMLLLVCTLAVHAQFEKNKWFVNTSVTGLGYHTADKKRLISD